MLQESLRKHEERDSAFRQAINSMPRGRVSSYGRVAVAAGYPLYHRAVAQLLRKETLTGLPWQRILGSNGEIRLNNGDIQPPSDVPASRPRSRKSRR